MQSILNQQQPGLKKFIAASVIIHIIILFLGLFFAKTDPARVLSVPTFTTVELVSPPAPRGSSKKRPAGKRGITGKRSIKKPAPVKSTARVKKPAASKKVSIKKTTKVRAKKASTKVIIPEATKARPLPATKVKELDTVSAAIAALEQKEAERAEDELIEQRISELAGNMQSQAEIDDELAGLSAEILESGISVDVLSSDMAEGMTGVGRADGTGAGTGTGFGGRSSSVNINQLDIAFIEYYNTVGSMIRSEWIFPGQAVTGLQAIVTIKIAPDGKLLAMRVEHASGNTLFDQSAVKAVEKVGDFPPLPEDIDEEYLEIGIRFCPGGCKQ